MLKKKNTQLWGVKFPKSSEEGKKMWRYDMTNNSLSLHACQFTKRTPVRQSVHVWGNWVLQVTEAGSGPRILVVWRCVGIVGIPTFQIKLATKHPKSSQKSKRMATRTGWSVRTHIMLLMFQLSVNLAYICTSRYKIVCIHCTPSKFTKAPWKVSNSNHHFSGANLYLQRFLSNTSQHPWSLQLLVESTANRHQDGLLGWVSNV